MIKIRKGQRWQEIKGGTIIEIDIARENTCSGDLLGSTGRLTTSHDILRRYWVLITQAPDAPPPRIALPLIGATPTHCGVSFEEKCCCLKLRDEYMTCGAFGEDFEYYGEEIPARLPECLKLAMEEDR